MPFQEISLMFAHHAENEVEDPLKFTNAFDTKAIKVCTWIQIANTSVSSSSL